MPVQGRAIGGALDNAEAPEGSLRSRMVSGGAFLFDETVDPVPLWGEGDRVAWADGEGLMIAGPTGVGKTTLGAQVMLSALGIGESEVLGMPVSRTDRVLYLAMDRPNQIRRLLRRMVEPGDRGVLAERLMVWKGPPPRDLAANPDMLTELAEAADADVVVVDSLKDAALNLSDGEVGAAWNRAVQTLIATGANVLVLHHGRKAGRGDKAPTTIDDLYGSTWLTAGMGSVFYLNGAPGDLVVELRHLKQAADDLETMHLVRDDRGVTFSVQAGVDIVTAVRNQGSGGMTVHALACLLYANGSGSYKPKHNEIEKARRRLNKLTESGDLVERKSAPGFADHWVVSELI
jgi:replicative DNA helicase